MTDRSSIREVLEQIGPEPDSLLRALSPHITDDMLAEIAAADYGEEVECHLSKLRLIRDTATPPMKMEWCPTEVLELMRWSQPEDPTWKPGSVGIRGHWMRAFCCAVLLRALREPSNYDIGAGNEATLAHLILSTRKLPIDLSSPAAGLLAWLLLHSNLEGRDESTCVYGLGLLWFSLQTPVSTIQGTLRTVPDEAMLALALWICQRSIQLRPDLILNGDRLPARMGITDPQAAGWKELGLRFCELNLSRCSAPLREIVEEIGLQLAE